MESAYSVTLLSIAYMVASHALTHTINSRLLFQWGAKVIPHNWVCKYM